MTIDMPMTREGGSLTREQKQFYEREGYLVLDELLNADEMSAAKAAMEHKVSLIADALLKAGEITDALENASFETRLARLFDGKSDSDFLRWGRGWRDRFPGYYDLMMQPKILDAVESLIGPELFSNPVYNTRPKVPRVAAGAVPWHQDRSYWPDANANPVITVWIPLVDATLENGCLHMIPGTHTKKVEQHGTESYSGTGYTTLDETYIARRKKEIIALPVRAGSAILFNDRLIHSSTPNLSNAVRWSVDLRYQPTDQDPMPSHGAGFLARSHAHPERVATLHDWLEGRLEHDREVLC